jgi:hypothetical protein
MIFSQDASALYPTIKKDDILKSIWKLITESKLDFTDTTNSEAMGKYLAVLYPEADLRKHGIISCIPVRQVEVDNRQRSKPGIAYLDVDTYDRVDNGVKTKGVEKWTWKGKRSPSTLQRNKMVALVLMKTVETLLENHIYCFDGQIYRQREGGPIGDRLTTVLARLIMRRFAEEYKAKLIDLKIYSSVKMLKIYVDDLNCATRCLPWGTTFVDGKLHSEAGVHS